jgi:hypothetical protein
MKDRYYSIDIANNGYVVNVSWWDKNKDDELRDYKTEKFIFTDWDEVLVWLKDNKLEK